MYIIKVSDGYFTGSGVSIQQRDAKRYNIEQPTSTFRVYLALLMGADARFVKLTSRADRACVDDNRDYYDSSFDDFNS